MTRARTVPSSWLAVAMAAATAGCLAGSLILIALGDPASERSSIRLGEALALMTPWLAFAIVGTIIVRRRPGNRIGWLCCTGGLTVSIVALSVGVATYGLAMVPTPPIATSAAWIAHTGSITIVAFPLLILFRFPTGHALGRGWRWVEVLTVIYVVVLMALVAVEPMPLLGFPTTPNPFALGSIRRFDATAFGPVAVFSGLAVASLIVRFRQGSILERRQLRLLALASVLVGGAMATMMLTSPRLMTDGQLSTLTVLINAIAFTSVPAAIGIAIVRDRLYDIDRIVNRTLVYGLVSAILALVYGVTVIGLTGLLAVLTPEASSTIATAASTLVVAALFRPVRSRAQVAIDRRFDRERYEASRSIESFAGQVRAEVELDAILGDLRLVAERTVRPTTMACWIRRPDSR